jgi:amino acid adenylation domain-containing protein/non-ribosomal peptide synthase protein (TIGR01720 family)
MLFHHLDAGACGVDIEQVTCVLDEALDRKALLDAWQNAVDRHAILRTGFRWQDVEQPRQEVYRRVAVAIEEIDWSARRPDDRERLWLRLLAADRQRGFDLSTTPLMRLRLVEFASNRFRLLWTFHHILLDGRSFPIILREVFTAYQARRDGQDVTLPEPRLYRDYIAWLGEQDFTRSEKYWRQALGGYRAPVEIRLPRAADDADLERGNKAMHELRLSRSLTSRLQAAAGSRQITLNTLLQAAWALLIHHYSGEQDIVFGATRACRRSAFDAGDRVGLFINTLPMRVRIHPEAALSDMFQELRAQQLSLRDHEHTPLFRVQGWSEVPRTKNLFESIIVFEHFHLDDLLRTQGGEWLNRRFDYFGQTNYPLALIAYAGDELLLRLEYDCRRFDPDAIARMASQLATLMESMTTQISPRIRDVALLTRDEQRQLLEPSANGPRPAVGRLCLHELFEAQAEQTPDATAVVCGEQSLTYRELNQEANRLARLLQRAGVKPDVLVGLCAERSVELVIGILGILKAGGAYLPLDPSYPQERLRFMIDDSRISILLAEEKLRARLPDHDATLIYLNRDPESDPARGLNEFDRRVKPNDLAYVIYTSGSTGKPKGVLITHKNVTRLFSSTETWFDFDRNDVWTLFHSYAFDFSVWEMWGALLYGGRLVVVPHETSRSPEEFARLIVKERVTVLNQTPSAFRQVMDCVIASIAPEELPLRYIIFGGEALDLWSLRPWIDRYGDRTPGLINMYGITETTVHVTYRKITHADLVAQSGSVIGGPIADLRLYVLNAQRQPVPMGVAGELYVGGAGVARGYLHRPELTAERFLADPFRADINDRLYRTGDLARRLPNGDLEYLGRVDQQVKIRGFRIELGEIEAVLTRQPGVREAVVVAREDSPGDKRLVAYFVADANQSARDIRAALCAVLPEHMVPASLVRLAALPLTANGKIDRVALPRPELQRSETGNAYAAPRFPTEEMLCRIWREILGVDEVGIHDNFFALGGDSILAIQVISGARRQGLNITPRDLFQRPTVAELVGVGTKALPNRVSERVPGGQVELTPIQQWFFEQNLVEPHHWNQAFLFEVPASLDPDVLEAALQEVIRHHDAFRLRFAAHGSTWRQTYAEENAAISLARFDLSSLAGLQRQEAIAFHAAGLQRSFDLTRGPLIGAAYFYCGDRHRARLLLAAHHLIIDGVSWRILMEDLESAYDALLDKRAPEFPAKTSSFRDWSAKLRTYAQTPEVRAQLDYWRQVSGGAPTNIPADANPDAENLESGSETVTVRLYRAETRELLQRVPAAYQARVNDILLAALADALKSWTDEGSFLIDLEGHGREEIANDIDVSRTLGWFTTIHPVRLETRRDASLVETVRATKKLLREVPRRGVGHGALRYLSCDAEARSALAESPQAQLAFNYLGRFDQVVSGSRLFRFAKEFCGPWHSALARRRHVLEVLAVVVDGCFEVNWTFCRDRNHRGTIEALARRYLTALRALIEDFAVAGRFALAPADFPLANLEQASLDRLVSAYPTPEDIYPLSAMQRLFLSMHAAGSKVGVEQWQYKLIGPLDVNAFKRAWQRVIERHSILRSAFVSDGLLEPLQVVSRKAEPPWSEFDWRTLPVAERQTRLSSVLAADRDRSFDVAKAPLSRFILTRHADDEYYFVWTTHHLLIDGWSWPVIFKELAHFYSAERAENDMAIEPACLFRDYIAWLGRCDSREAEAFWRSRLKGLPAPTSLGLEYPQSPLAPAEAVCDEESGSLSRPTTGLLQSLARRDHLTLNTIMQGAWALLLSRLSGQRDILFGAACSGRSPEVPGIESMVGPCVNDLPVRVQVKPGETLPSFLKRLQDDQFSATPYQYPSVIDIHAWSEIPLHQRLFESLLVFQNYAPGGVCGRLGTNVEIQTLAVPETTNYPVTLVVVPGDELHIKILYRAERYPERAMRYVILAFQRLLAEMVATPEPVVDDLLAALPAYKEKAKERDAPARRLRSGENRAGGAGALPQTDSEKMVAAVWRALLHIPQIGIDTNFFDLGGHSLLLVEMHKRLEEVFRRRLPLVTLFQHTTVRALARHLNEGSASQADAQILRNRAEQAQRSFAGPARPSRNH